MEELHYEAFSKIQTDLSGVKVLVRLRRRDESRVHVEIRFRSTTIISGGCTFEQPEKFQQPNHSTQPLPLASLHDLPSQRVEELIGLNDLPLSSIVACNQIVELSRPEAELQFVPLPEKST